MTFTGILESQRNMECKLKSTVILEWPATSAPYVLTGTHGHDPFVCSPFWPLLRPRTGVLPPGPSLSLLSACADVTCFPLPPYAQQETLKCRVHNVSSKTSGALYGCKSRSRLFRTTESYSSTLSLGTAHLFSSCSHSFSFPLLLDSPLCPRLLFLFHALFLPSLSHFLSPASSPPPSTSIISTLQAHHSDIVLVFSCPFSAWGSLFAISFPSNILSSFLYLKIKQFIWWSTTPVENHKQFY